MDTDAPLPENINEPALPAQGSAPPEDTGGEFPEKSGERYPVGFEFHGQSGEYFRIWIVNLFLSLVTLGFYIPWALVRSRRYIYANTYLDGHTFDYLAKPKNLLIGYLIVLLFFTAYQFAGIFNPAFVFPLIILYAVAFPWLIFKALRFRARNVSYRNVRFLFTGSMSESYTTYLGLPLLIPFSLGLIVPYWEMRKTSFMMDNLRFGNTLFDFDPDSTKYYKYYFAFFGVGMLMYVGLIIIFMIVAGISGALSGPVDPVVYNAGLEATPVESSSGQMVGFYMIMVIIYVFFLIFFVIFKNGIWLKLFNYNMTRWQLGQILFKSEMKLGAFLWISLTNTIASIFSLGLLIPWAKIRKMRYICDNLYMLAKDGDLGEHIEADSRDVSAFGEAATDFMDIEIGL